MQKNEQDNFPKKETNIAARVFVIVIASFIFAVSIKTFVHTGGLIPGGATGLTLLIQEFFDKFFSYTSDMYLWRTDQRRGHQFVPSC